MAVPAGNPAGITGLDDFSDEALLIGLCAEEVPCGDFGRQALENAGVTPAIDTNEPDVRALLTKIAEGELDAGIVYVTDVLAPDFADDVEGIEIPAEVNVVAEYPIVALTNAPNPRRRGRFRWIHPFQRGAGDSERLWLRRTLTDRGSQRERRGEVDRRQRSSCWG